MSMVFVIYTVLDRDTFWIYNIMRSNLHGNEVKLSRSIYIKSVVTQGPLRHCSWPIGNNLSPAPELTPIRKGGVSVSNWQKVGPRLHRLHPETCPAPSNSPVFTAESPESYSIHCFALLHCSSRGDNWGCITVGVLICSSCPLKHLAPVPSSPSATPRFRTAPSKSRTSNWISLFTRAT